MGGVIFKKSAKVHRDCLDTYCSEISKHWTGRPLSKAETISYFSRYRVIRQDLNSPDLPENTKAILRKEAASIVHTVTSSCLPYVVKLAQDFSRGTNDRELLADLVSSGNEGLCKAFFKYDVSFGVPFHFYASNWIKACIRVALKANSSHIRVREHFGSYYAAEVLESGVDLSESDWEIIKELQSKVSCLPFIQQLIFNFQSGLALGKGMKFMSVARMLGSGISSAFVKKLLLESYSELIPSLDSPNISA